jgi:hypothetical protein
MKCPVCGGKVAPRNQFCANCGKPLPQQPAEAKAKNSQPAPSRNKHYFVIGGVAVGVFAVIALLLVLLPSKEKRKTVPRPTNLGAELTPGQSRTTEEEIGSNTVYGEVVSMQRGQITVRGLKTGKEYTVYVGRRTNYAPRRYPTVGEKIRVLFIYDRGYMKATQVEIQP